MRKTRAKTQVGALSGHDHGITEHGREPPAFSSCYPVCVPPNASRRRVPPNVLRPLNGPLFDMEDRSKCSEGGGFEILGPVKDGEYKGRYVRRPCPACIYLGKKVRR